MTAARFALAVALVAALTAAAAPRSSAQGAGFVTADGTQLVLDGQPFRFTGMNVYNANSNGLCWYAMNGSILDEALTQIGPGKKVMRSWFFQQLATSGGERDWTAFDRTLATARAHGIKVIAALIDQWGNCGSPVVAGAFKDTAWYEGGYKETDPAGIVSYYDWAAEVVDRYKDDPTILAWELVNEPEVRHSADGSCEDVPESYASALLKQFAADVSSRIKAVDPNHLVSLGLLGSGQCGAQDTDYQDVMSVETLDLCSFHDYSTNSPVPGDQWNGLQRRLDQCRALDKPLFVGELGVRPTDVGGTFVDRANVLDAKLCAQFERGVTGVLAWAWSKDGSTADNYDIGPGDPVLGVLERWGDPAATCVWPTFGSAAAGDTPSDVEVDPTTGRIYVTSNTAGTLTAVDPDGSIAGTIQVTTPPFGVTWDVSLDPERRRGWVTVRYDEGVAVVDLDSNEVVQRLPAQGPSCNLDGERTPLGAAVNRKTARLYVAQGHACSVAVYDAETGAALGTVSLPFYAQPTAVAVDESRNLVYVTESARGRIAVIDGATQTLVDELVVGEGPEDVEVDEATNTIYVANYQGNSISVVDGATRSVVATLPAGSRPRYLALAEGVLYLPHPEQDYLTAFDTATRELLANVPLSGTPFGAAVDIARGRTYVAGLSGGIVSIIAARDRRSPLVSCGDPDGAWHAQDVSISCTARDPGGLASVGDASFTLATTVSPGVETAAAETAARQVCDAAGNCTQAGPIGGNKVDKKAPVISVTTPAAGATYLLNQQVPAVFSCTDGGSGTAAPGICTATPLNGAAVATDVPGKRTFVVTSRDAVGNEATPVTRTYTVVFSFAGFFSPLKNAPTYLNVVTAGRGVPVRFSLRDAAGASIYPSFGLGIFTGPGPTSAQITCPAATKNTVTATTTSTTLGYSSTTSQYEYGWRTSTAWRGTCRQLTLKFKDGTSQKVNFQFK